MKKLAEEIVAGRHFLHHHFLTLVVPLEDAQAISAAYLKVLKRNEELEKELAWWVNKHSPS